MTKLTYGYEISDRYIHKPPEISSQTLPTCGGRKCLLHPLPQILHRETLEFPPLVPAREIRNPTDAVTPPRKRSTARPQDFLGTKIHLHELHSPNHLHICWYGCIAAGAPTDPSLQVTFGSRLFFCFTLATFISKWGRPSGRHSLPMQIHMMVLCKFL